MIVFVLLIHCIERFAFINMESIREYTQYIVRDMLAVITHINITMLTLLLQLNTLEAGAHMSRMRFFLLILNAVVLY